VNREGELPQKITSHQRRVREEVYLGPGKCGQIVSAKAIIILAAALGLVGCAPDQQQSAEQLRGSIDVLPQVGALLPVHLMIRNEGDVATEVRRSDIAGVTSSGDHVTPLSPPRRRSALASADQECVVFYGVRGKTDVLFELLDDNRNIVGTLTTRDFIEALEEQKKAT
jgi:hypothetical protein